MSEQRDIDHHGEIPLTAKSFLQICQTEEYAKILDSAINKRVRVLEDELKCLRKCVIEQKLELDEHRKVIIQHEKIIQDLMNKNKRQNVSDKLNNLRIVGLPDDHTEAKESFLETVNSKLEIPLKAEDIELHMPRQDNSHERSRNQNKENKKKPCTIKFNNFWDKRKVYLKRFQLPRGMYASEDLTKENNALFYLCRQKKKDGKLKSTWTFDCNVFVQTTDGTKIQIRDKEHLENVLENKTLLERQLDLKNPFYGFTNSDIEVATKNYEQALKRHRQELSQESFVSLTNSITNVKSSH